MQNKTADISLHAVHKTQVHLVSTVSDIYNFQTIYKNEMLLLCLNFDITLTKV